MDEVQIGILKWKTIVTTECRQIVKAESKAFPQEWINSDSVWSMHACLLSCH